MSKSLISLLLTITSTFSLAKTVATVNGQKIDSLTIDKEINILKKQKNITDNAQLRNAILDSVITSTIVTQEAKKLKLDQTKEYNDIIKKTLDEAKKNGDDKKNGFKDSFEFFKEQLLIQVYATYINQKNPISENDVKKYYDEFKKYYTNTKEVKLGNIFTKSKDDINKALDELKKGNKFQDIAKKYSIVDNVKSTGGISNNYVNLKDIQSIDAEIYNTISKLKKGKNSDVIFKNDLYGILYLEDIRNTIIKNYNEMKNQLENNLKYKKAQEAIAELAKKAKVDINK